MPRPVRAYWREKCSRGAADHIRDGRLTARSTKHQEKPRRSVLDRYLARSSSTNSLVYDFPPNVAATRPTAPILHKTMPVLLSPLLLTPSPREAGCLTPKSGNSYTLGCHLTMPPAP
jgi:hypothetical protein